MLTKRQYSEKDLLDDRFGRLWELPIALTKKNIEISCLCLSYRKRGEESFREGGVQWGSINLDWAVLPGFLRYLREAAILAEKAHIIWACSDSIYGIMGYLLAKRFQIPLVYDLYDNFDYFYAAKLPFLKQFHRYVVRNNPTVTCVSDPLKDYLRVTCGRRLETCVLENAVNGSLFYPEDRIKCRKALGLPLDSIIIGTAGALSQNRGIEVLFEVFSIMEKQYPNLILLLAGAKNIRIPDHRNIKYLGLLPQDQVKTVINAMDVAVICNRENDFGRYCFPQKAREIMACNIPLVAAKTGSMEALFSDHPDWLFMPDDAKSLEQALVNRFSDRATAYENIPSWEDLSDTLAEIMHSLVIPPI